MSSTIRLCLVLHNHQPVGNFDGVFEQAYQDSYLPFLDVFDRFPELKISLHTSGPLMEWLDQHHGEYVDRLADHVASGRIEIIGGAFYEPILTMIPSRDRIGQITRYTNWLESRLNAKVRGMWVPERVWEQSLTSDLAAAGIEYTVLDDFHFRNAGLEKEELNGYYVTEDEGSLLRVFPGSEQLRYMIPFAQPHETIEHLRTIAQQVPNAVAVFGDDGEKFGTWPETKKHVYDDGWLERFLQLLTDNRDWLLTTTLSDAADSTPSVGKVYLPDASYREMTEWALPVAKQNEYEDLVHEMHDDPRWARLQSFMRGGFWRNFKVKYPETNNMYARMMMVSQRLHQGEINGADVRLLDEARDQLYRGQCNCSYWHGAFGGVYLPHLRNAVYKHLIAADNLIDRAEGRPEAWVQLQAADYNLDGETEVRLNNEQIDCLISPRGGGQLYELDMKSSSHNLLATLARRKEAYHRKVLEGQNQGDNDVASIHDRVVFKQEGLDQRLQYDAYSRYSLVDHFFNQDENLDAVARGQFAELGDFVQGQYEATLRRNPDRMQCQLIRNGHVAEQPVRITKGVTLNAGSDQLEISYLLEGLSDKQTLHFGIEFNFAGLPAGADDRFFFGEGRHQLGQLGTRLDIEGTDQLGLCDQWLGVDVQWHASRPTNLWTFPVETVSQSEGGFELVHQSVVVIPRWHVLGDADGRWSVTMSLSLKDLHAATQQQPEAACSTV